MGKIPVGSIDVRRSVAALFHKWVGRKAFVTAFSYVSGDGSVNCGCDILVEICDVRISYGKENILIRPIMGRGQTWILADNKVEIMDDAQLAKLTEEFALNKHDNFNVGGLGPPLVCQEDTKTD